MSLFQLKQTLLAVCFFTILFADTSTLKANDQPNFIVIFCDDLGYGDLGCYGHPTIATPHLDRMATEGQRWTNFYVGASVCTPSRAALLTGRVPIRSGMMSSKRGVLFPDSKGGLPQSETTIAELLKEVGYLTAAIGKWHLGHLPEFLPTSHGFDSYWGIPYSNDMDPLRKTPSYKKMVKRDPNYVASIKAYNVPILEGTQVVERPADQRTITKRYTQKTIDFIKKNQEEPFFIYLAHSLPHIPLFASDEFKGKSKRGIYGDTVEEIDAGVGEILGTLEDLDLAKNTLVVFTSDNGPWLTMGQHGGSSGLLHNGKGTTYEGGMRVPAIFWWPGKISEGVKANIGTTMDLLPTFCSLSGVKIPTDRIIDGYDISRCLTGESTTTDREAIYYWRRNRLFAVRYGPWKAHFITCGSYGDGEAQVTHDVPKLYHLDQDPAEQFELSEQHPEVIEKIKLLAKHHAESIMPVEDQLSR